MPPQITRAILLCGDGVKYKDIAVEMGVSMGRVKRYILHGRMEITKNIPYKNLVY